MSVTFAAPTSASMQFEGRPTSSSKACARSNAMSMRVASDAAAGAGSHRKAGSVVDLAIDSRNSTGAPT
jgi:hypothetical protein